VPGAAAYEILLRSTTTPAWQRVVPAADTTIVVDAQLDDLWEGVRSVGAHGSRSLATVVPESRPPRRPPQR